MRIIKAVKGQTVFDLALQEMGSVEGVFRILELNKNLSLHAMFDGGEEVLVSDEVINRRVRDYFSRNITVSN